MASPKLRVGRADTSHGTLHFLAERDPQASSRPLVVMLHGALRYSEHLRDWLPVLRDRLDVVLADLPGHGRDPGEGDPTPRSFLMRLREFLGCFSDRPTLVVGESVGGLFALGLASGGAPGVRAVIAADPPLSTAKQWVIRLHLLKPAARVPTDYQRTLFAEIFGYDGDRVLQDRLYYPLVANAGVPTLILTGDRPLFPAQAFMPENVPCAIDDVDRSIIDMIGNANVSVETIKGAGHLCMDPALDEARSAVEDFCRVHLFEGAL